MKHQQRLVLVLGTIFVSLMGSGAAHAQIVTWFPISPQDSFTPTHITSAPDGALWFTDANGGNLARLTTTGAVSVVPIPHGVHSGTAGIAWGPDGALWFTEIQVGRIGRLSPTGSLTEFEPPSGPAYARDIVAGPDGALWFTESLNNRIGRITTAGAITEFPLPTPDSFPAGIAAGPDGALWFTEATSTPNQIGRIATDGTVREFGIPTAAGGPLSIATGPDGNLWFTELFGHAIGRITPAGAITEFQIPAYPSRPSGITPGPDGNLWFVDTAGSIGQITTAGAIREFPLARGVHDYESGITIGSDGALWFTWAGAIGRFALGPCATTSLCLNGGRFHVEADWRVPSLGSSGHGSAVSLTADSGYFWFFSADNVEMVVKVVDGCAVNGRHWVFAGGLTNVEVTLTVTDTRAGGSKRYVNSAGTPFQPIQDTAAFAGCLSIEPVHAVCTPGPCR